MADDERNRGPQRGHGAFQPIEALDDSGSHEVPGPQAADRPDPAAPPETSPQQSGHTADSQTAGAEPRSDVEPSPIVDLGVQFGSAASALVYAGQLHAIGSASRPIFGAGASHVWWVFSRLPLDLGREFASATRGQAYVYVGEPGTLVPDLGWGAPPGAASAGAADAITLDAIERVDERELIRVAGLHQRSERALPQAHVLLPGRLAADVVRRASDLRLTVEHRAVRLSPLFAVARRSGDADTDTGDASAPKPSDPADFSTLIQLRISAQTAEVPPGFLAALAADTRLTVCRGADEHGSVLIEYGMAGPLADHQLAALGVAESWLLSRSRLGSRVIEPQGTFTDATTLLRLTNGHAVDVQTPIESDPQPARVPVRVIRARTPGRDVDAILLATGDLDTIGLLLEGHPLADGARLVPGRDRHLLLAPGGLLERLPLGEALYCLGPGPLYLPLGFATSPEVPPSARGTLFGADADTAVVVLPEARLQFDLTLRRPAWQLWIGEAPQVDEQVPPDALAELDEIEQAALIGAEASWPASDESGSDQEPQEGGGRVPGRARRRRRLFGRSSFGGADEASVPAMTDSETWLDEALAAELSGALIRAADLHARHGDPVRAAHLYQRAAMEGSAR